MAPPSAAPPCAPRHPILRAAPYRRWRAPPRPPRAPLARRARADGRREARRHLDPPGVRRWMGAGGEDRSWRPGHVAWSAARGIYGRRLRHGEADVAVALLADQVRRARDHHDVTRLRLQRMRQANHDLIRRNG